MSPIKTIAPEVYTLSRVKEIPDKELEKLFFDAERRIKVMADLRRRMMPFNKEEFSSLQKNKQIFEHEIKRRLKGIKAIYIRTELKKIEDEMQDLRTPSGEILLGKSEEFYNLNKLRLLTLKKLKREERKTRT